MPGHLKGAALAALGAVVLGPAAPAARAQPAPPPPAQGPPSPAPATDPPVAPPEIESELLAEGAPKLDLYGFADFAYQHLLMSEENRWTQAFTGHPSFAVGNLNLYLDGALAPRWRSLVEVRFSYLPQGNQVIARDGTATYVDNTVRDPAEFGHQVTWGGIVLERAWLEYQLHSLLTLRGGLFLTPYGIWNVDHGSTVVIGVGRPFTIRERLFPERQTGIELYGTTSLGEIDLAYHVTLSNGRGPATTHLDFDGNKALGARLQASWRGATSLTFGASGYRGRFTARTDRFTPIPGGGSIARTSTITSQYDETSLALDARLARGNLHVQAEAVAQERVFTEAGRKRSELDPSLFYPDSRRWGVYALVGYRTRLFGIMPYVTGESYRFGAVGDLTPFVGHAPAVAVLYAGLNARPVANVVLKLELTFATFPSAAESSWGRDDLRALHAQAAWAF
jgi:hypothetical protein